jgi:hypothetical protein
MFDDTMCSIVRDRVWNTAVELFEPRHTVHPLVVRVGRSEANSMRKKIWFRAEAEGGRVRAKGPGLGNVDFSPNPTRHRTLLRKTVQFLWAPSGTLSGLYPRNPTKDESPRVGVCVVSSAGRTGDTGEEVCEVKRGMWTRLDDEMRNVGGPRKSPKSGRVSQKRKVFIVSPTCRHLRLFPLPPYAPLDLSLFFYATMLILEPGSLCDVCADEFGPRNLPHCIPCGPPALYLPRKIFAQPPLPHPGHVLCLSCCDNILEKTTSRLSPACPFCREQFTRGTVRLIRIDFNGPSSGWSTPRRSPNSPRPPLIEDDFTNDLLLKASAPAFPDPGEGRAREGRVLESKVARVASKKCSVEEVSTLQKEVDRWLTEVSAADAVRAPSSSAHRSSLTRSHIQSSALYLSSLLLKAILANHVAFSESSKVAKHAEATLKLKVDELELEKGRLEVEYHK